MRVLQLNTTDAGGGAARGCRWLHEGLVEKGVDSNLLVLRAYEGGDRTESLYGGLVGQMKSRILPRLDNLPVSASGKSSREQWSTGLAPNAILSRIDTLAPDLVHLHWIGSGFVPVHAIKRIDVPVVWTLRDMWAFTGGCHYSRNCDGYRSGCGNCPQLRRSGRYDLSRLLSSYKNHHYASADVAFVALSQWLADCAERSSLLAEETVDVIPNGIPTDVFRPVDQQQARNELGLPPDKRLVLFGAIDSTSNSRKGFSYLEDALRKIAEQTSGHGEIAAAVFGNRSSNQLANLELETHSLGYFEDNFSLRFVYSAADVMVVPSVQEAFGKTVTEAMGCGTPVVCFEETGCAGIIEHKETGYVATHGSAVDLANGIRWVLEETESDDAITCRARTTCVDEYSVAKVSETYIDLYEELLD